MARFKVTVSNSVYEGSFHGQSVEVKKVVNDPIVFVYEDDDTFTTHRSTHVESIELEE